MKGLDNLLRMRKVMDMNKNAATIKPKFTHYFKPMTGNRTKCDICTRTAGAPSHKR